MTPKVAGLARFVAGLSKLGWFKGPLASALSSTFQPSAIVKLLVTVMVCDNWLGPRNQDQRASSGETLKFSMRSHTSRLKNGFSGSLVVGSMRSPRRSLMLPEVFGLPIGIGVPFVSVTVRASPLW